MPGLLEKMSFIETLICTFLLTSGHVVFKISDEIMAIIVRQNDAD